MQRRKFLELAAIAPAVASAPLPAAPLVLHGFSPDTSLDDVTRLIAATADNRVADFEGWTVLWTGWKTSYTSIDLVHQWAMRPISPFGIFSGEPNSAFYISMPGMIGLIRRGEMIDVTCRWNQMCYGVDLLARKWGRDAQTVLQNAQRVTARLALEAMRGAADFSGDRLNLPWGYQYLPQRWRWEKLSAPSAFYVDPGRYLLERHGLTLDSSEGRDMADRLVRQLYGAS